MGRSLRLPSGSMPRRSAPDPMALAVGRRIRQIRSEQRMTAEKLAFESDLGSKGYLSDIESGRASPSLATLHVIAEHLDVLVVDLLTIPERSDRERLIDRTRWLTPGATRKLLREMPSGPPPKNDQSTERAVVPGPVKSRPYPTTATSKKLNVADPPKRSGRPPVAKPPARRPP